MTRGHSTVFHQCPAEPLSLAQLNLYEQTTKRPLSSSLAFFGLVGIPLLLITVDYVRILRLRRKMPPGPFPLPIIGTVGRIPMSKPWITFEKWAQDYRSPLITLWTGTVPTLVVNDCWTADDLMNKRANIYSSRPHMVLVGDMFDESTTNQTSLVYGDQWRLHRKIMVRF
jgi:hypothetical protein